MNSESKAPTPKLKCGYLWLQRAILAQKLQRSHLSERAFRNVVEQGFSLSAWTHLLELYNKVQNPKSIQISLCELLTHLEEEGLSVYSELPAWIQRSLATAIQIRGLKFALKTIKENGLDQCELLL